MGRNEDEWLFQQTLFPYFAAFHPAARWAEARKSMLAQGQPHWSLGLMPSKVANVALLRYCLECSAEDRASVGHTHWRRTHLLPGVFVCPKHRVWLEISGIPTHPQIKRHVFFTAEDQIPPDSLPDKLGVGRASDLLLNIATRSATLLERRIAVSVQDLRVAYFSQLKARDLATYSGRLRIAKLRVALQSHFGDEVLAILGVEINETADPWWLRILRKPRVASHTLYHVLIQQFLNLDIEQLAMPLPDFGRGPWRCLNKASDHFGCHVVTVCKVGLTSNDRKPIGTFRCTCGFHYRRVGPDQTEADSWRLDRMADYGEIWLGALRRGWADPRLSLRKLAKSLGFDCGTVRAQATRLGMTGRNLPQSTEPLSRPDTPSRYDREKQCTRWLDLRRGHPLATQTELRRHDIALYTWLYRNEKAWLHQHSPTQTKRVRIDHRVDWDARDRELEIRIRAVADQIRAKSKPLLRLTKSRLGAEAGAKSLLEQHIQRLPLANAALNAVTETADEFAVRRIRAVGAELLEGHRVVPRWQFVRLAGLRPSRLEQASVAEALDNLLQTLALDRLRFAR